MEFLGIDIADVVIRLRGRLCRVRLCVRIALGRESNRATITRAGYRTLQIRPIDSYISITQAGKQIIIFGLMIAAYCSLLLYKLNSSGVYHTTNSHSMI